MVKRADYKPRDFLSNPDKFGEVDHPRWRPFPADADTPDDKVHRGLVAAAYYQHELVRMMQPIFDAHADDQQQARSDRERQTQARAAVAEELGVDEDRFYRCVAGKLWMTTTDMFAWAIALSGDTGEPLLPEWEVVDDLLPDDDLIDHETP